MKAFRIIVDSSSLIGLAQIGQMELLNELFSEVYVPDAVYEEVVIEGIGEPGAEETEDAIRKGWIIKKTVADKIAVQALSSTLGKGEAEVIILYKELGLDYAIIDEKTAREMAGLMEVKLFGIIGILDIAVRKGFRINKKDLVDKLIEKGFRISNKLYKRMFPG